MILFHSSVCDLPEIIQHTSSYISMITLTLNVHRTPFPNVHGILVCSALVLGFELQLQFLKKGKEKTKMARQRVNNWLSWLGHTPVLPPRRRRYLLVSGFMDLCIGIQKTAKAIAHNQLQLLLLLGKILWNNFHQYSGCNSLPYGAVVMFSKRNPWLSAVESVLVFFSSISFIDIQKKSWLDYDSGFNN